MRLYVNGQDIARITFATLDDPDSLSTIETGPEGFLQALDAYLKEHDAAPADVREVWAVVGPGSATALRAVLSIADVLAFTQGTALKGIEKPVETSDSEILDRIHKENIDIAQEGDVLAPKYENPPKITPSRKDQLGLTSNLQNSTPPQLHN